MDELKVSCIKASSLQNLRHRAFVEMHNVCEIAKKMVARK